MSHSTTRGDAPRTTTDPEQFTFGLLYDVNKVLESHGYGPFDDGRHLVELGQHLLHFLHGRGDRCYGGPAVTIDPPTVDDTEAATTRRLAALRESGPPASDGPQRGHEL